MSDVLKQIYNACDPLEPASAEYYMDLAEVRGSSALTQEFQCRLGLANDRLRFLFTGHIGSGKSSELQALSRSLDTSEQRYLPVVVDASAYLDDFDTDIPDLLLVIVTELAATFREQAGVELRDQYLVQKLQEITGFLSREVEVNELPLPKGKIQLIKRDPSARVRIRAAVNAQKSAMLEEMNTLLDSARLKLKGGRRPYTDLVLIIDNLEKIQRFAGKAEGPESQRELFLERAPQLTGIDAHVVYTVPLRLAHHYGPQLRQRYDEAPFVLPMVKVIERGTRDPYGSGLNCLRELLQKRLGGLTLDEVFEPEALDFLLAYSGGHVRNLMTFIQTACTYTDGLPIPLRAAHRAIQQTVRMYATAILEPHWEKLARLELSADEKIDNGDLDHLAMLEDLSILEYVNGGSEHNIFESAEPWYAVNPIVRELQRFKAAVARLRNAPPPTQEPVP